MKKFFAVYVTAVTSVVELHACYKTQAGSPSEAIQKALSDFLGDLPEEPQALEVELEVVSKDWDEEPDLIWLP